MRASTQQPIFTLISLIKGQAYPLAVVVKMSKGFKIVGMSGRTEATYKDISDLKTLLF
jgi:hypothetical protein